MFAFRHNHSTRSETPFQTTMKLMMLMMMDVEDNVDDVSE